MKYPGGNSHHHSHWKHVLFLAAIATALLVMLAMSPRSAGAQPAPCANPVSALTAT